MPTIDGGGRDQRIKEALEKKVICRRCQVEMVPKSTFFDYLGHNFHTEILCCPKCGEVICMDEDMLFSPDCTCPNCGTPFEVEYDDEDESDE